RKGTVPGRLPGEGSEPEVREDPRHLSGMGADRILQSPFIGRRGERGTGEPKLSGPIKMVDIKRLAVQDAEMNLVDMNRMSVRSGVDHLPQFETSQARPGADRLGRAPVRHQQEPPAEQVG